MNLHLSRDHKLSPEASKFLTDVLEFLVEDAGRTLYLVDRAKSDLCLLVAYNKEGYGTSFGPIGCLYQLGIMSRPYTDRHGTAVIPTIQPIVEMDHDVFESFEENFGRKPTEEESQAIQDAIIDAAASTPEVGNWAQNIDLEALHALELSYDTGVYLEDMYAHLTEPKIPNQARKRFMLEFPALTGFAYNTWDLFETAKPAKTVEEAYQRILDRVQTAGFARFHPGWRGPELGSDSVGPMPIAILERFRAKIDFSEIDSEDFTDQDMANVLKIARCLEPDMIPDTLEGMLHLATIGFDFYLLQQPFDDDSEGPIGFGLELTDDEIKKVLSGLSHDGFASLPQSVLATPMKLLRHYGMVLAGHEDFLRHQLKDDNNDVPTPEEMEDFAKLKKALIDDGFVTICEKAFKFDAEIGGGWKARQRRNYEKSKLRRSTYRKEIKDRRKAASQHDPS